MQYIILYNHICSMCIWFYMTCSIFLCSSAAVGLTAERLLRLPSTPEYLDAQTSVPGGTPFWSKLRTRRVWILLHMAAINAVPFLRWQKTTSCNTKSMLLGHYKHHPTSTNHAIKRLCLPCVVHFGHVARSWPYLRASWHRLSALPYAGRTPHWMCKHCR